MNIQSVGFRNFRGIKDASIHLYGQSTILFGVNGTGKSSVLRGINLLYAGIINRAVNRKGLRQNYPMQLADIQYGKPHADVAMIIKLGDNIKSCVCGIVRKSGTRNFDESVKDIAMYFQDRYEENGEQGMPVFVSYGTNRLVLDVPLRIRTHHEFDMYSAFEKAIENQIAFRTFFEWFRNQEDYENQCAVESGNLNHKDVALEAVRKAMLSMLEGCSNIRVARKPRLEMKVEKDGISLNVTQMSDGEKCTLALFGDLARRLTLANPNMENPLLGDGVVLIDEIELHMHPAWQRKVLKALRDTFPNIQFIITTHSPIVLSEADAHYQLLYMDKQDEYASVTPMDRLDGYDANAILEQFMGTSAVNAQTEQMIHLIHKLIRREEYDEAEEKIKCLAKLTSDNHPDVLSARMEIRRRQRR